MSIAERAYEVPAANTLPLRTAWCVLAVVFIADMMDLIDPSIARTRCMTRSFDQGPNRDHDVKGVPNA